jgi:hypothetical protein
MAIFSGYLLVEPQRSPLRLPAADVKTTKSEVLQEKGMAQQIKERRKP